MAGQFVGTPTAVEAEIAVEALIPAIKASLSCLQDSINRASNMLGILEEQTVGPVPANIPDDESMAKEPYSPLKHIDSWIKKLNSEVSSIGDRVNSMTELIGGEVSKDAYEGGAHGTPDSVR